MAQCSTTNPLQNLKHIMIIAGEPSGDLHGAALLEKIKQADPCVRFTGIGGDMMKARGMDLFFHINKLSVMGVTEVISRIRIIKKAFDTFRTMVIKDRPSLVIVIDYPGFNLRAAAFAWKNSIPVLYYITPKVWAWNRARIKKIRKYVSHAALILPFEEPLFKKERIPSTFVGHPLLDYYTEEMIKQDYKKEIVGKDGEKKGTEYKKTFTIGLLPGSREAEIDNLFEIMLESAQIIQKQSNSVKFLVSMADSVNKDHFNSILKGYNQNNLFEVIKGNPVKIFEKSDFLVAASGTVTLEAAICGIPMVIIYKMSFLSYLLAKSFVRVKYAGLANIIAGREIVPELLQNDVTCEKIAKKVITLLNTESLSIMRAQLLMVRKMLGSRGAAERTAKIALGMVKKHSNSLTW